MADFSLQWWQAALGLLTVAGFSAAPWVAALLRGRLIPLATVDKLMGAKDDRIQGLVAELARADDRRAEDVARAVTERDHERDAVRIERARSDDAAKAVMHLSQEYGETMLHLARGGAVAESGS